MHVLTYHFENRPLITSFLKDDGDEYYIDDNDESDNSYDNSGDDDEDN